MKLLDLYFPACIRNKAVFISMYKFTFGTGVFCFCIAILISLYSYCSVLLLRGSCEVIGCYIALSVNSCIKIAFERIVLWVFPVKELKRAASLFDAALQGL